MSPSIQESITLEMTAGPNAGRRLVLDRIPGILGRGATCDVRLDDPFVSRTHCLIDRVGHLLYAKDLDSHNGIYVNGVRTSQTFLRCGSVLRVGETVFRVRLSSDGEPLPAEDSLPEPTDASPPVSTQRSFPADATTEDWNEIQKRR